VPNLELTRKPGKGLLFSAALILLLHRDDTDGSVRERHLTLATAGPETSRGPVIGSPRRADLHPDTHKVIVTDRRIGKNEYRIFFIRPRTVLTSR